MSTAPSSWRALAHALQPPGSGTGAFETLGLPRPAERALRREHMVLFGRAGHAALSPYEGVHRGTGLHEILSSYVDFGFAPDPRFRDRPDHVCVQLALAGVLAEAAELAFDSPELADRAHQACERFFDLRIRPWVPGFFERLASEHDSHHYAALGRHGARFLEEQQAPAVKGGEPALPSQAPCTECGKPVGFVLPREGVSLPAWASLCAPCRFRVDLRRLGS